MEVFAIIIAAASCFVVGGIAGWALGSRWRRDDAPMEFERRPIEPREDAVTTKRAFAEKGRHARVSTAHVSQRRPQW